MGDALAGSPSGGSGRSAGRDALGLAGALGAGFAADEGAASGFGAGLGLAGGGTDGFAAGAGFCSAAGLAAGCGRGGGALPPLGLNAESGASR